MKNTLKGIISRLDKAEEQISNLEDQEAENSQSEQQKEKESKNEGSLRSLRDNLKYTNICIIGVPEGEESKDLKIDFKNDSNIS